jgi:hypothetical protein
LVPSGLLRARKPRERDQRQVMTRQKGLRRMWILPTFPQAVKDEGQSSSRWSKGHSFSGTYLNARV